MRVRSGVVLAVAFAGLLLLVLVSLLAARRKAQEVYTQLDEVNMLHRHVERKLRRLRSEINLSGIFIRDYLLDNVSVTGPYYREQLAELRRSTTAATHSNKYIYKYTGAIAEEWVRRRSVGRPPTLQTCEWCKKEFGARDLRLHRPHCPARLARDPREIERARQLL